MSSLRNILFVRIYSFTSPASFVPLFQLQFWADSQLRLRSAPMLPPRHTVTRHRAARHLFLAASQQETGGRAADVEECEELASHVLLASLAAVFSCSYSFFHFVQQVIGCWVTEELTEGAGCFLSLYKQD